MHLQIIGQLFYRQHSAALNFQLRYSSLIPFGGLPRSVSIIAIGVPQAFPEETQICATVRGNFLLLTDSYLAND